MLSPPRNDLNISYCFILGSDFRRELLECSAVLDSTRNTLWSRLWYYWRIPVHPPWCENGMIWSVVDTTSTVQVLLIRKAHTSKLIHSNQFNWLKIGSRRAVLWKIGRQPLHLRAEKSRLSRRIRASFLAPMLRVKCRTPLVLTSIDGNERYFVCIFVPLLLTWFWVLSFHLFIRNA